VRRVGDLGVECAQHEQHAAAQQLDAAVLRLQQQLRLRARRGDASAAWRGAWRGGRNRGKALPGCRAALRRCRSRRTRPRRCHKAGRCGAMELRAGAASRRSGASSCMMTKGAVAARQALRGRTRSSATSARSASRAFHTPPVRYAARQRAASLRHHVASTAVAMRTASEGLGSGAHGHRLHGQRSGSGRLLCAGGVHLPGRGRQAALFVNAGARRPQQAWHSCMCCVLRTEVVSDFIAQRRKHMNICRRLVLRGRAWKRRRPWRIILAAHGGAPDPPPPPRLAPIRGQRTRVPATSCLRCTAGSSRSCANSSLMPL
jgi:hypothetical protein